MLKTQTNFKIKNQKSKIKNANQKSKNFLFLIYVFYFLFFIFYFSNAYALDLNNMKIDILKGDYKQAILEGEKILATQEESRDLDELYYLLGMSYLKDGNYLRASDIFEIILKEFPDSRFKDEAKLGLGDTYLLRANFDKAQTSYEELLKGNPNTKLKALVYHRFSQIGFKKGDTNFGKIYLDLLRQEFPTNMELILNKDLYIIVPKPAATEVVSSSSSYEVYYTVQVGSFSKKANAENLVQKLTQEGRPAFIEEISSDGKQSFRVRVGKFSSRQEAVNLEEKLSQEGYPTKIFP